MKAYDDILSGKLGSGEAANLIENSVGILKELIRYCPAHYSDATDKALLLAQKFVDNCEGD